MKLNIIILLITIKLSTYGQNIQVDTLYIIQNKNKSDIQKNKFIFPIIKTDNNTINDSINSDIKNKITNNEFIELSTDSSIIMWAEDIILTMDFEITYLKNSLISFIISYEGCGANCSKNKEYFTYNYLTGKYILIDEIINIDEKFKNIIISNKDNQYNRYIEELKEMFNNNELDINIETYEWIIEEYKSCSNNFSIESFILYDDHIEIIDNCGFPNAIKSMSPIIELNYKYKDIQEYLKIKN